jgi:iron complex outermembrane receptor protein
VDGADSIRLLYTNISPAGVHIDIGDPKRVSLSPFPPSFLHTTTQGQTLTLNYRMSDSVELTSVTGYRDLHIRLGYDLDGGPAPILFSQTANDAEVFFQEGRASITAGPLRAILGVNYYNEKGTTGLSSGAPTLNPPLTNPFDTTDVDATAVFGQVEYDLTPQLTIVGGLRANWERRDFTLDYRRAPVPGPLITGRIKDDVIIPSVGINYKATEDILLYAKASQGYQAPGFNLTMVPGILANTFGSEKLWAYEAGAKTQFLDRRLTLNVSAYYYDYKDLQVRNTLGVGVILIQNAATATVKGVEATVAARLPAGFTVGAQVNYSDASYSKFCQGVAAALPRGNDPLCAPGVADRSGNPLTQAPAFTGGINLAHAIRLGDVAELRTMVNYSWESNAYFNSTHTREDSTGGWDRWDARLGLQLDNGPEIYVFGKNLTNNQYLAYQGRAAPTFAVGSVSPPRTYGFGMKHRF